MHLQACRRRFREFGAISGTYQNGARFKTTRYSPGYLLEIGRLKILPTSSWTIPYIVRNPFATSMWAMFLGSLGRFPAVTIICHFQNHGLFAQNRPNLEHIPTTQKILKSWIPAHCSLGFLCAHNFSQTFHPAWIFCALNPPFWFVDEE